MLLDKEFRKKLKNMFLEITLFTHCYFIYDSGGGGG